MKYFHRISRDLTLDGTEETYTSKERIDAERSREDIQKNNADESDSLTKVSGPGNLKKKN